MSQSRYSSRRVKLIQHPAAIGRRRHAETSSELGPIRLALCLAWSTADSAIDFTCIHLEFNTQRKSPIVSSFSSPWTTLYGVRLWDQISLWLLNNGSLQPCSVERRGASAPSTLPRSGSLRIPLVDHSSVTHVHLYEAVIISTTGHRRHGFSSHLLAHTPAH